MLKKMMYVRCPADIESIVHPRVFVCGQITEIDDFKRTVTVKIHDPFGYLVMFEDLPRGSIELPIESVSRCSFFVGSMVVMKGACYKVISCTKNEDDYHSYYIQNKEDKTVLRVSEKEITAAFNNGQVDPCVQLLKYEFQNPAWYFGRSIVSRSMNILENSIFGFKELAGSKIFLMPHQVNTIMRCLQDNPCRYMLADEVGMGKTIEAISIYKIMTLNRSETKALVITPATLKEQWISELLLKFNIPTGENINSNYLTVKTIEELDEEDVAEEWDYLIVDEIHKYLGYRNHYETLHAISSNADNVILLSATPVQQKKEEYLDLLRLLSPHRYDSMSLEEFGKLVDKQGNIIQKTALILDDLGDLEEEVDSLICENKDAHDSEDCIELFEDIKEDIEGICEELKDEKLIELLSDIKFEDPDLGVYAIKVVVSYICSNYQIESNIIRNRRKILEAADGENQLVAKRELIELTYELDDDSNGYEKIAYDSFSNWIIKGIDNHSLDIDGDVKPLLSTFFSSASAFYKMALAKEVDEEVLDSVRNWISSEKYNLEHINDILNDPDNYPDSYASRLVLIIDALYEDLYDKKVVLFTNYQETFNVYREAIGKVFPSEEVSFFSSEMLTEEIELNAYRFQNQDECRIMLCDYTGGEGRNFQCADYIIHIDLPWDASAIEQRIGRLDRLERDLSRPIVYSIVAHAKETFEDALFNFFKDGLKIFNQSLSGMEIIMEDINAEIISSIKDDFKYGLFEKIPMIVNLANSMRETIRKEQIFDAAGFIYRPMYSELRRLIEYYSQNENSLFSSAMLNWASLAGFRGTKVNDDEIVYSANSFSPKSAINSQLIPPEWNDYLGTAQNQFISHIQSAYDASISRKTQERSIRGTFSRKKAIENDYLHFFAPGDAVFECIVDNALNSCKGTCSAFATLCGIEWTGFIFTWSVVPNTEFLLDNEVSIYTLSPYRNYLCSEQAIIPVSIINEQDWSDQRIAREYLSIINRGIGSKSQIVHLGKRGREAKFLSNNIDESNIDWFMEHFGGEEWGDLVRESRKTARDKAFKTLKSKTSIKGAKEEMERVLSARAANSEYYGINDLGIEELRKKQEVALESLRCPRIQLESAAFIMMVRDRNG